ncbi:hypothetical protein ABMA28_001667 [Loxostege sticticalis]|uniref:TIL domain-containing protein n=1 Tax=Loxostege sticticalis TaxID=481309 RepID=A0ABD0T2J0_LOXSC
MLFILFFCYVGLVSATAPLPPTTPCPRNLEPAPSRALKMTINLNFAAKNVHKKCGKHEHPVKNMSSCQKTCGNRLLIYPAAPCAPYSGCVCNEGYVRPYDNATGTCIPVGKCPPIPKKCGCNEQPTSCAQVCPPESCDISYTTYICDPKAPCEPGCNCKPDHLRDANNKCIPNDECPPPDKCCDDRCRPTCAVPNPPDCPPPRPYDPKDPCQCPPEYILSEKGGKCIHIATCPDNNTCNGKKNAIIKSCAMQCPATCDKPNSKVKDCKEDCKLGCECKPGYILSKKNGECIRPEECPCGNPCKRPNEVFTSCTVSCTTVYCPTDDIERVVICDTPSPCDAGCVCAHNHRRLSVCNDTCIPAENCPEINCTRKNEKYFSCRPFCPREQCSEVGKPCSPPFVRECNPRCTCKDGTYKNNKGVCVEASECRSSCPLKCKSTCANPNPIGCEPNPDCNCKSGYVWRNDGRKCIPISQCPTGKPCNGDPNAHIMKRPPPCPPTCDDRDGSPGCKKAQLPVGCACNEGYLFNEDGICVKPEKCPGSSCPLKCKSTCANPNPIDCDPNPDCNCKSGYVWTNDGRKCIPISQCPSKIYFYQPDKPCNGDPNAHIMKRPPPCPPTCDDRDGLPGCKKAQLPVGCACNEGYLFNENGICVKPDKCPGSSCPLKCKSTCANPNPIGCDPNPDCNCKSGYVWTNDGHKCIPISHCPTDKPCNGDDNAHIMERPPACPSTCNSPDGSPYCRRAQLPVGCACNIGYLYNDDGICVKPDECPGGNPCGVNGTFAPCKMDCPSYFCPKDGRPGQVICDPAPNCPPGCVCAYKYRWRSEEDRTCILAQECPERECPGPCEEWNSCPSPCLDESCEAYNNPPTTCNTLREPECNPMCTCIKGHARNNEGTCIPGKCCPSVQKLAGSLSE